MNIRRNEHEHYGAFLVDDSGRPYIEYYATAPDIESLKQLIDNRSNVKRDDRGRNLELEPAQPEKTEFGKQIWNCFKALESYYYLASYITDALPSIGRARFKSKIVDYAEENFIKVELYDGIQLYSLDSNQLKHISDERDKIDLMDRGTSKIRYSILLSIVATFDSIFSDFCRFVLLQNPERYHGSDRTYSVSEILKLNGIQEIIDKVVNDEIDQLMAKSHSDQVEFFCKNFGAIIDTSKPRWADFVEVFERRNLAAHGDLIVNRRYIDNCQRAGLKALPIIGSLAKINSEYVKKSLDVLIETIVILTFQVWRKRRKDESEKAFGVIIEITFEPLKDGHNDAAINICDFALNKKDDGLDASSRQYLTINKAIGLKALGLLDEMQNVINSTDFSASSALVKLGVACLQDDLEPALALLEPAKVSDHLNVIDLRHWPIFQWARKQKDFCDKVLEIFGEGIVLEESEHKIEPERDQ